MRITFELAGQKQVDREILRVGKHLGDATPAFQAVGRFLMAETRLQFDTEGRHASGGWQPLAHATARRKERLGLRPQILQATGALRATLTEEGTPGMVFEPTRDGLTFGTRLPYAAYHQRGNTRLPRRAPLELTEQARRQTVKIVQRFLLTGEVL